MRQIRNVVFVGRTNRTTRTPGLKVAVFELFVFVLRATYVDVVGGHGRRETVGDESARFCRLSAVGVPVGATAVSARTGRRTL